MFQELLTILAPVFVCAGLGYLWARLGRAFDTNSVTALVTTIGTPCLILSTLTRLEVSPAAFADMALAAILALAVFAALGVVVLRAVKLPFHTYLPALMFANTGNMGLPLCLFAFGQAGLALAIAVFTISAIGQFTIGALISSGHVSLGRLARTPVLYAVALALAFMLTGTQPPRWLANTVELIGGLTIPLMLFALGVSLARLRVQSFGRSLGLALLRLASGLAIGLLVAEALGMSGIARGVLILQSAMPVAVFNYLFAQYYNRTPEEVAGIVVLSTVITFALLPLLLLLVL